MFPFFAMLLSEVRNRARLQAAVGLREDVNEMIRAGDWDTVRWTRAKHREAVKNIRPTRWYPRPGGVSTRALQERLVDAICHEILFGAVN